MKMLLCQVAQLRCAIAVADVQEILPIMRLSQSPGLPRLLAGSFVLDAAIVPVIRLSRALAVEDHQPTLYTPLILLRRAEPLALLVDAVIAMIDVARDAIMPLDGRDATEGVVDRNGSIVSILSPDRLLLAAEEAYISEWRACEQARLDELHEVAS